MVAEYDCKEISSWINDAIESLPIAEESFFNQLWKKKKLSFEEGSTLADTIDENTAKLVCSCIDKAIPLICIIPDGNERRISLTFSTALLKSAIKTIKNKEPNHRVLYFGTTARIKHTLSKTSVRDVSLSSVFTLTQTSGKVQTSGRQFSKNMDAYLPEVICVYQPVVPEDYIEKYSPDWIAVDCGDALEVDWFNNLISKAKQREIPVIAWSNNILSSVVRVIREKEGQVLYCPESYGKTNAKTYGEMFCNQRISSAIPVIVKDESLGEFDEKLRSAKELLLKIDFSGIGYLEKDAIKVCWTLLRTIDRMVVPINIYNAESSSFRFIYSLDSLLVTIKKYRELTNNSFVKTTIDDFVALSENTITAFEKNDPPYWKILCDLCSERSAEKELQVLVFPKRYQKQLFIYTLLSKCNIDKDELFEDSKVLIKTLGEFYKPNKSDLALYEGYRVKPTFIGLPDNFNRDKFSKVLRENELNIIILPHQVGALYSIINGLNKLYQEQINDSFLATSVICQKDYVPSKTEIGYRYDINQITRKITVNKKKCVSTEKNVETDFSNIKDLHTELSAILDPKVELEEMDGLHGTDFRVDGDVDFTSDIESPIINQAIKITSSDRYDILVDPSDLINVYKSSKIDQVYARSLRPNDKIVLIDNQSKCSLYDLIIGRVHNHPSFELHVGLLRKWRDEFHLAYSRWKDGKSTEPLSEFLKLMQEKGSAITTTATISNWINGYVLRPHDQQDLKRIGEILDIKFLLDNYSKVYSAAARIVGIHIGLSRKLNEWLAKGAINNYNDDMDIIDEKLNLTFGELRSSIRVLRILELKQVNEPILRSTLGHLEKRL